MKTPKIQHGQCVWANGVGDELFAGRVALPPRVKKQSRRGNVGRQRPSIYLLMMIELLIYSPSVPMCC